MTFNIREQAESDLKITMEGEGGWGLPVILYTPDGVKIDTSANSDDPVNPDPLTGQILYDTVQTNPDTGEDIVVNNPVVTLRRSSLSRVPLPGEKWIVKIPTTPSLTATLEDFVIDPSRPPEGGASIGFIRLYLRRAKQS